MNFNIKNLGKIEEANIDLKDLTVICGPNSANKTWLAYSIYHKLSSDKSFVFYLSDVVVPDEYRKQRFEIDINSEFFSNLLKVYISNYLLSIDKTLCQNFNTYPEVFSSTSISSSCDKELNNKIKDYLISSQLNGSAALWLDIELNSEESSNIISITLNDESEEFDDEQWNDIFITIVCDIINGAIDNIESFIRPFVITSERVGGLVFQKDIDGSTLKIVDELNRLMEMSYDNRELRRVTRRLHNLTLGNRANLSIPVRKNLEIVRNAEFELKKTSFIKKEHPYVNDALRQIVKGKYEFDNNVLTFKSDDESFELPITVTSSSVKSLFMIDVYINSLAKKGDLLIIDEPELNLHPDNQRMIARVITRLVNSGVKVLITTHSDYLIREINNSIMLSSNFDGKDKLIDSKGFIIEDILDVSQVSAYSVDNAGHVELMNVSAFGIESTIFDNVISDANKLQDDIMFAIDPSLFEDE